MEYLDDFESGLEQELLSLCTMSGKLKGVLLSSEDIDAQWDVLAPEYLADAVLEVADYPDVAVSWAAYLGMAIASGWDCSWENCRKIPYKDYYGPNGFDDMDDHIVTDILGMTLDGKEAEELKELLLTCSEKTIGLIRHEQVEPQSVMAYHIFTRAAKAMYRIGAALQLQRLGYRFEKIQ